MKVCVIGTGPTGLTTIKQLRDEGHEVNCFEKQEELGGIWHRHAGDDDQTKAYDDLKLTISIRMMAFSDFMPDGERVFYDRAQYQEYLLAYAARFRLRDHIVFRTTVEKVARTPDRRWRVTVSSSGMRRDELFDAVAVCSGSFQTPNMDVTGLTRFTGEVMHSARYRNAARFAGKRVLVIGLAESGADVLRQISDVSSQCTLSIRSYSKLIPRIAPPGNIATDATTNRSGHFEKWVRASPLTYPYPALFGDSTAERLLFRTCTTVYGAAAAVGGHLAKLGRRLVGKPEPTAMPASGLNPMGEPLHPPKMDLGTELSQEVIDAIEEWNRRSHAALGGSYIPKAIYCKNVSFIPNILNGKLDVKHGEILGMDGKTVHFPDGTSREFDAVVLCTGYKKDFSFLEGVSIPDNNVRHLYRHAFHPDYDGTLALIGFVRPFTGGIPISAEIQARYFALLLSGKRRLPADVRERIAREKAWEEEQTVLSPRHTEAIPSQPLFTDAIAKEIGVLPTLKDLVLDPPLLVKHWFGSFNQSSYRIVGPHALGEEARRRVLEEWMIQGSLVLVHCVLPWFPHFVHPKSWKMPSFVKARFPKGEAIAAHPLRVVDCAAKSAESAATASAPTQAEAA